jgi:hypothetical protein
MMLASLPFKLFSTSIIHICRVYSLAFGAAPLRRPGSIWYTLKYTVAEKHATVGRELLISNF